MRKLHRWLGLVAGLFLLIMALSGTVLQFHELEESLEGEGERPALSQAAIEAPGDAIARAAQIAGGGAVAEALVKGGEQGTTVSLRRVGQEKWQRVELASGAVTETLAPGERPRPQGFSATRLAKGIHTGGILGVPGHIFGLLLAASLLFFVISGIKMWLDLYRARKARGRSELFWS